MEKTNPLKESLGNFLRNLWDLMILNWLWLLCCLPLVTIGPATCGLFAVTLKLVRGEPVYAAKDFFRNFRDNFKPALLLGLLTTVILVVACGDIWFALQQTGSFRSMYLVIGILVASVFLTLFSYVFALMAMFENPLKAQIANAFKLAFVAPGKTIVMWLIWLIPVLALLVLPPIAVDMLGFLYVLVGGSGPAYVNSRILRNLFDQVHGSPVIPEQTIS